MIQLTNQVYKADIFEKGRTFDKSLYYFGWFQFLQVLSYDSEGVEVSVLIEPRRALQPGYPVISPN